MSDAVDSHPTERVYAGLLPIAMLAGLAVATFPTSTHLLEEWDTLGSPYGHGYLAVALAAYLFYRTPIADLRTTSTMRILGVISVLGAALLWYASHLVFVAKGEVLSQFAILVTLLVTVYGLRSVLRFAPGLLLVALSLPIWQPVSAVLQAMSTAAATSLLRLVDIPILVQGNEIATSRGVFEVADGCSGIGFFLTTACLTTFASAQNRLTRRSAFRLILVSLSLAVLLNWLRISIIVYAGYESHMRSPLIADHLWLGWILYVCVVIPAMLFVLLRHAESSAESTPTRMPTTPITVPAATAKIGATLAFGFLACLFALNMLTYLEDRRQPAADPEMVHIPFNVPQARVQRMPFWNPQQAGADAEVRFADLGQDIILYAAYYARERQGKEAVFDLNDIYAPYKPVNRNKIATDDGSMEVARVVFGVEEAIVLNWYEIDGVRYTGNRTTKFAQLVSKLRGNQEITRIALYKRCEPASCDATSENLVSASKSLVRISVDG